MASTGARRNDLRGAIPMSPERSTTRRPGRWRTFRVEAMTDAYSVSGSRFGAVSASIERS